MSYQDEINKIKGDSLYRSDAQYERKGALVIDQEGQTLIDFASNDYLGLSQHPKLIESANEATVKFGVGSGAARLISGTSAAHKSCEEVIAHYKQTEAALFLANGFVTALAAITSLIGRDDVVILDKLSHACLIDGVRFSGARYRVFPHNNTERLESLLRFEREKLTHGAKILVVVESVYSMDGDLCPLPEIVKLKDQYGALLLIDEAHGFGVLGSRGMGLAEELGLQSEVDIHMGTLGKAAGGAGGYLAVSKGLRELFVNKGRSFIFTTAPPPSQAAVAETSLHLIASEEGAALRAKLSSHRALVAKVLGQSVCSAICPIMLGENEKALQASRELRLKGFLVPAIRYPTVANGSARLRLTLSAGHSVEQVKAVLEALSPLCSKSGN